MLSASDIITLWGIAMALIAGFICAPVLLDFMAMLAAPDDDEDDVDGDPA